MLISQLCTRPWERLRPVISIPLKSEIYHLLFLKQETPIPKTLKSGDVEVVHQQWDHEPISYLLQTSIFSFLEWGKFYLPCLMHKFAAGFKRWHKRISLRAKYCLPLSYYNHCPVIFYSSVPLPLPKMASNPMVRMRLQINL